MYVKYKEQARVLVHERLMFWNRHYGFTYGQVSIRDQKTRWGSCSKKEILILITRLYFFRLSSLIISLCMNCVT